MFLWAGLHGFVGWIWPVGCSSETPGLRF